MTSLLAATRTTEFASRVRFSTVGGIAEGVFVQQIDSCKSFNDTRWTEHWIALANEHLKHLDNEFEKAELGSSHALLRGLPPSPALISFLGRGAAAMTQTPPGTPIDKDTFPQDGQKGSFIAVNALLEAIACFFVAAWPGQTPARLKAYRVWEALFDVLLDVIAPTLSLNVESQGVPVIVIDSETTVSGVLVINGLEGTNVETVVTALRTKAVLSSAWFFMEMPGTYAYKQPLTKSSSKLIYNEVLTFMALHKLVDGSRLGMFGISFEGNCATRVAMVDKRLKVVFSWSMERRIR
ncbi:hypothetical protein DER46DRAFT_648307 [Fusarium sp. MPI-SDFR-AT-0072]|nr:hypothetical protein DER46DRAFT_648307 [Fusarium sp. MPI-SDFR-AT-0072]